jgi:cysteine-rich repeat protein
MRNTLVIVTILPMILAACSDDDSGTNQNNNTTEYTCGDGTLDPTEQCDDGSANSDTVPDACRTDCRDAYCNDGVLDSGEVCDDGDGNSDSQPDACRTNCNLASCGDGTQDATEICDDGNTQSEDGCSADCLSDESCGNGIPDTAASEQCDCGLDSASLPQGCDTPNDDLASHCTTTCQNLCGWSHCINDNPINAKTLAVAVDPAGNVAITGHFTNSINLGGASLGDTNGPLISKAFVALYDAHGNHIWSIWLHDELSPAAPSSEGHGVAFDSQGDIYTMGRFESALTLGGDQVQSHSGVGTYVLKLDGATGTVLDHTQLGASGATENRRGWGLTIDHNDNLLIVGEFIGQWECGSGPCDESTTVDPFVVKLDSSLGVVWTRLLDNDGSFNNGFDTGLGVAVDSAGDVFFSGVFQFSLNLGVGHNLYHGIVASDIAYVAKLSGANGDTLWGKMLGSTNTDGTHFAAGVTALSTGTVVVTGAFLETLTLSPAEGEYSASEERAFMVAYAGDGTYLWHHTAGTDWAWSLGVTHDDNDNLAFVGYFENAIDLGGGTHQSQAESSAFLVRTNAQGDYLGSRIFGSTGPSSGVAVAAGPSGTLALAGYSQGNIDFGCEQYLYSDVVHKFKPFVALLNPF